MLKKFWKLVAKDLSDRSKRFFGDAEPAKRLPRSNIRGPLGISAAVLFMAFAANSVRAAPTDEYIYCYGQSCHDSLDEAEAFMRASGPVEAYFQQFDSYISGGSVRIAYKAPEQQPEVMGDIGYYSGLSMTPAYACTPAASPWPGSHGCKNEQEAYDLNIAYLSSSNGVAGCYASGFHLVGEWNDNPFDSAGATPYDAGYFVFNYDSNSNTRALVYTYACPGFSEERRVEYQKIQDFKCQAGFRPFYGIVGGLDEIKRRWPWKTYCGSDARGEIVVRLLQTNSCEGGPNPCFPATGDKARFEPGFEFAGRQFEHVYHSVRQFPSRLLPAGWRMSFEERLTPMIENQNRYVYVDAQGYVEYFWFAGNSGDTGYSASASGRILKRDPQNHEAAITLRTRDGDVRSFDRNTGFLVSIKNPADPKRDLLITYYGGTQYNDGRVAALTDGSGREVLFTYKSHNLLEAALLPDGKSVSYDYDLSGNLSGITTAQGTREYHYEGVVGLLTGISLEDGQRYATFGYDSRGRVNLSQLHSGTEIVEKTTLQYVGENEVSVTTPSGETRQFQISSGEVRNVAAVTGLNGTASTTYDYSGRLMQSLDPRGVKTTYEYVDGFRAATNYAVGTSSQRRETYEYDGFGRQTARRSHDVSQGYPELVKSYLTQYNTDGTARAKCEVDASAPSADYLCGSSVNAPIGVRQTVFKYCTQADVDNGICPLVGAVLSEDGPRIDVLDITEYAYFPDNPQCDPASLDCPHRKGDLRKITNALGQVSEILSYDGAGRVLSARDANGLITDFRFDDAGRLSLRKVRGGSTSEDRITRIAYWPTGLVKRVTLPDGSFTTYRYDNSKHLVGIDDSEGNRIRYTLDAAGNRVREDTRDVNGALMHRLSRLYDITGRMESESDAYGNVTAYTYDPNGNRSSVGDALGRSTDFAYDPLNRLIVSLQDAGGISAQTQQVFDSQGNLIRVTDAKGLHTDNTYNGLGDLTKTISPDTGTSTYSYDSAGNRTAQTDARDKTQSFSYDELNRLVQGTGPSRTYHYDSGNSSLCPIGERFAKGRLSGFNDPSGNTRYCYNRFGDLTRKVQTTNGVTLTVRYAYDAFGRPASTTYPDGTVLDAIRDTEGRITEIGVTTVGGSRQVVLTGATHAPFGPSTGWTYGNGRTLSRSLNRNYQPDAIHDGSGGGLSIAFGFDTVGNLTQLWDGTRTQRLARYNYDALYRLVTIKDGPTGTPIETIGYDATGNRTSLTASGTTTSYTYPSVSHRLKQVGSILRTYDGAGNTTKVGSAGRQFVYDNSGRMTQVKANEVITQRYEYDAQGQKTRAYLDASNTYFVYDETGNLLGEYDSTGTPKQQILWFGNMPVGVLQGSFSSQTLNYVEPDHVGSPRVIIDSVRNVAVWEWHLTGDAFGATPPNQDVDGDGISFVFDLRYPGQRFESATGLFYNRYRDYDPGTGRYVESDPIGLNGGMATYAYVGSNPLNDTDLYGMAGSQATRSPKPKPPRPPNQRKWSGSEGSLAAFQSVDDLQGYFATGPKDALMARYLLNGAMQQARSEGSRYPGCFYDCSICITFFQGMFGPHPRKALVSCFGERMLLPDPLPPDWGSNFACAIVRFPPAPGSTSCPLNCPR